MGDEIAERIRDYTGGYDNELRNHRMAIKALAMILFSKEFGEIRVREARKVLEDMAFIDHGIETIIKQGKDRPMLEQGDGNYGVLI